jgi:hypothetical protein
MIGISLFSSNLFSQSAPQWKAHDMARPKPPIAKPAEQKLPVPPPSDALVLFDGHDLSQWRSEDGSPSRWTVSNGYMESVKGSGYIFSRQTFGDIQLHLEWATPVPPTGKSQGRGNSGVFPMGLYEVQVLDSYENETYADGQAAAVYGQYPPLVNVCHPPGEWQTYDLVFRRPRFSRTGELQQPARLTLLHNGVLVQDNVQLWGPTNWLQHAAYAPHPDKLPLSLQDHGNPVRFRNIWLRELSETSEPGPARVKTEPIVVLQTSQLDRLVGKYRKTTPNNDVYTITREGQKLVGNFSGPIQVELVPSSDREFFLRWTAGKVVFDLDGGGTSRGLTFYLGGEEYVAKRTE